MLEIWELVDKNIRQLLRSTIMIMDAGERFDDFDEDALRFLNILEGHMEGNLMPDVYVDDLKTDMEQEEIPVEQLDALLGIMQSHMILEHHPAGGRPWITIRPHRVREVQRALKSITCPKCNKWTLAQKIVIYCSSPDCDYHRDKE